MRTVPPPPSPATAGLPSGPSRAAPRRRLGLRLGAALLAAATLLGGCAVLDEQQRKWIFQPGTRSWAGAAAAEGLQDVWIDFESRVSGQPVRLHGLWLPQPAADAPVLLYLHGARWDVRSSANRMRRLHAMGFAVLGIDYRGFGRSTDELPSEDAALEDAQAAWHWLAAQRPGAGRYVFGHSLGGEMSQRRRGEAVLDAERGSVGMGRHCAASPARVVSVFSDSLGFCGHGAGSDVVRAAQPPPAIRSPNSCRTA